MPLIFMSLPVYSIFFYFEFPNINILLHLFSSVCTVHAVGLVYQFPPAVKDIKNKLFIVYSSFFWKKKSLTPSLLGIKALGIYMAKSDPITISL